MIAKKYCEEIWYSLRCIGIGLIPIAIMAIVIIIWLGPSLWLVTSGYEKSSIGWFLFCPVIVGAYCSGKDIINR